MGWTFSHRDRGISNKKWFEDQFSFENERIKSTVLECASTLNVAYLAVEHIHKGDGERDVHAYVILTRWVRGDWYNFGQKEMSECSGPWRTRCPAKVLDLLTPTDDKYALEWRAKCRDNLAKRKARPRLSEGAVIRLPRKIKFTNGDKLDTFVVRYPRNLSVTGLNGLWYGLTREVLEEFKVVKPVSVTRHGFSLMAQFDDGSKRWISTRMTDQLGLEWD